LTGPAVRRIFRLPLTKNAPLSAPESPEALIF
jgi:hypothetical protein